MMCGHCNDVIGNLHTTIWYAASRVTQNIFFCFSCQSYHVVPTRSLKLVGFYIYIYFRIKLGVTTGCGLSAPSRLSQIAAELLRFAEKFKMAASAILNMYLAILDHPRSVLVDLKRHSKFGVNRYSTFQHIAILKIWLKTPIQAPKITFLGVLTSKCYLSLLRPQKAFPWPEARVLSPHWSPYDARCDREAERSIQKI